MHIAGNFNLNLLDHESKKKVYDFQKIIYKNDMIPSMNKPHTNNGDRYLHIPTNSFIGRNFRTVIFKSDISDHFPICFIIPPAKPELKNKTSFIFKKIFSFEAKSTFKQDLHKTNWKDIETFTDPNETYKKFLERFLLLYDKYCPIKKSKLKQRIWKVHG